MAVTVWSAAIADIARELGFFRFATTTNLTTNNSIVSTNLADDYDQNDFFIGWYVIIRGSNNDEVVRRVTDYVASSGTLTVAGAVLAAESGAKTCELHRFHPETIRDHFNRARLDAFPRISSIVDYRQIITGQRQHRFRLPAVSDASSDTPSSIGMHGPPLAVMLGKRVAVDVPENLFTDPSFEDWTNSTTLASWTLAGSGATVNKEEQTSNPKNYAVLTDANSARIAVPTDAEVTLLQTVTPSVATQGVECNVSGWVYSRKAGRISISIAGEAGTTHHGDGWQRLTWKSVLANDATSVSAGIVISSSGSIPLSCYVDHLAIVLGQSEPLDEVWESLLDWRWIPYVIGEHYSGNKLIGAYSGYLEFDYLLPEQHVLRILSRRPLTSVDDYNDAFEAEFNELTILYDLTRTYIAREASLTGPMAGRNFWEQKAASFEARYERLIQHQGTYTPKKQIRIPGWAY